MIAITDTGAEPGDESTVVAGMKRIEAGSYPAQPSPNSPIAATFATYFRPATDALGKGWDFELTASQTAALTPGAYQFDYSITPAPGERFISDPVSIIILEPASL